MEKRARKVPAAEFKKWIVKVYEQWGQMGFGKQFGRGFGK
jgi:hypothetical protein